MEVVFTYPDGYKMAFVMPARTDAIRRNNVRPSRMDITGTLDEVGEKSIPYVTGEITKRGLKKLDPRDHVVGITKEAAIQLNLMELVARSKRWILV